MSENSRSIPDGFNQRVRTFAEILDPLFWNDKFYVADTQNQRITPDLLDR